VLTVRGVILVLISQLTYYLLLTSFYSKKHQKLFLTNKAYSSYKKL